MRYGCVQRQGLLKRSTTSGSSYASGDGVPQDHTEAMRWYRLAADQGYAEAREGVGQDLQRDLAACQSVSGS